MATIDEIKQQAEAVKNATQVGENTAMRVGGALSGLADIAKHQDVELGNKANTSYVDTKFTEEKNRVDTELGKKLPKDTDSESSISDGSEEFVVTDSANNVGLKVDKEGVKVKILNICDENGKVVKTITKEEVSEDTKSFSIIDLKGNKSLEVDNDGVKARKYIICDEAVPL